MAFDVEFGAGRTDRFVRRRPWAVALIVAFAYGALLTGVAAAEYVSEMQKIDRGAYTDTFPPLLGTALLSWPSSSVVESGLPAYPPTFDGMLYREVVRERVKGLVAPAAVQSLIVLLLTGALLHARRAVVWSTRKSG